MDWLKQNWKVFALVVLVVGILFSLKIKRSNEANVAILPTPSPSLLLTPTISNLPAYDLVYPDLASDVKSVYIKSPLKTTVQDLGDLFVSDKTSNPYAIKADGNFEFSFNTGSPPLYVYDNDEGNTFEDLKITKNGKVVFEDTTKNQERSVQRFTTVVSANYSGKSYYLIEGWSGGAHCCEYFYPIVVDSGNIKVGKQFNNEDVGGYGFFVKNGSVYVWMQNSNFRYFISSYAVSNVALFPSFYRIDIATGSLVPSDNEFKTFYAQFVNQKVNEVEKLKKNNFDKDTVYRWPPVLAARTIYQLKSGQDEDISMKQFETDFRILKEKYGVSEFIYVSYVEDYKKNISELANINYQSLENNGLLPDVWYTSGGFDEVKQDVLNRALGWKI